MIDANAAINVLRRRGWDFYNDFGHKRVCDSCAVLIDSGFRYCPNCGKKLDLIINESVEQDIEAAVRAGVREHIAETQAALRTLLNALGSETMQRLADTHPAQYETVFGFVDKGC